MGQLRVLSFNITFFLFSICIAQSENNILGEYQLENKLNEIALFYVQTQLNDLEFGSDVYIHFEKKDEGSKFYHYTIYDGAILNERLSLPYKYINITSTHDVVVFFFNKNIDVPKNMKEKLKLDTLWVSLENIDKIKKYKPIIKFSDYPTWDVFIYKNDISKYKIVKIPNE